MSNPFFFFYFSEKYTYFALFISVCVVLSQCPKEKSIIWSNQYPNKGMFSPLGIDFMQECLIQLLIIY